MSARKWACWHCGSAMKRRQLVCKACKRRRPDAVKTQIASLTKARGGVPVQPVAAAAKPPRPRCPNPACQKKGKRSANVCPRCSTPYSAANAALADKAAADWQARLTGSPEWWRRKAMAQHDPGERELMLAEAAKAAAASPASPGEQARMIMKGLGASTLREAWVRETDKRAQQILRDVMDGGYR